MSIKPQLMILLGAIVVGVIGIGAAFLLSRPSSEKGTIFGKIEKPDVDSIIRLQSKILSADFKNNDKIPKTGAVYKLNESEISNEKAVEMAAKLGFISRPSGIQTITWAGKNNTLTIDRVRRTLELKFLKVKSLKGNFQVDKLAETAVKFLEKNGFSTDNLAANTTKVRLFQVAGDELEIVEKTTNPVFIEIPFNRKLGNHYLFSPDPTSPAAVVILNSKGQVFRVYYKFADINKTTVGTYPLVDIKKLEPEKIVRFGSLVYPPSGRGVFEPKLIKTVAIEDFFLAYLDDYSGEFIQPIYVLRGYGSVGTENISVVVYYPAIEEKWLK